MKENDIRPSDIFNEYLKLAAEDAKSFFSDCKHLERACPGCQKKGRHEFDKCGFSYCFCEVCKTLYVNPVPEPSAFEKYYRDAPSTKFWASDFYKHTEDARREKLFKPKANIVKRIISQFGLGIKNVVDIGAGYGTFAQELMNLSFEVTAIEPNKYLNQVLISKGIDSVNKFVEEVHPSDLPYAKKCFTSLELIEHLSDPEAFFRYVNDLMFSGDLFVFTTLSATGADIIVLWDESKSVHPPHHLTFFNPGSIKLVLERCGFSLLKVTTPGKLDLDILKNSRDKIRDRFWQHFFDVADDDMIKKMQSLIREENLSSHMMVVATKR